MRSTTTTTTKRRLRTPSTYVSTWSQKKPQISTTRAISFSSSMPMSFAFSVTMPDAIRSEASCSRADSALDGDDDTTDWMWRLTSTLRSSLGDGWHDHSQRGRWTYIGMRRGSPLKRGSTWTCSAPQGSVDAVAARLGCGGAGSARDDAEAAAAALGTTARAVVRLPRRCISRETSFESYVRP